MTTSKKKLLLPNAMARSGWDYLNSRDDVEAVSFAINAPTPVFHALLRDVDGVALTSTPLRAADIEVAPHMAGNSRESLDRKAATVVRNLLSVLDSKPNREFVVNPEALD